ncbi:hypothetical protein ABS71_02200 [bacterium SCN 62-11]|nr:hypothetical protein [Candidatus Eremiobacteraeota bacterium]ODT78035.1 MAG: hypothetical protein ABS71_02200 [bacterium SCN 62-11]
MKKILWAFCMILTTTLTWAAPEPPDAALLEKINAGRDEKQLLKADQVRVLKPADFPEVSLIGYVIGQGDCLIGSGLVDNKLVTPGEACGVALRAHGWEQADSQGKIALALQWLEHAQFGFGETLLQKRPLHFGTNWVKWSNLETVANESGSVRVIGWVELRPTPDSPRRFHKKLYWFSKEGNLLRSRILETYEL